MCYLNNNNENNNNNNNNNSNNNNNNNNDIMQQMQCIVLTELTSPNETRNGTTKILLKTLKINRM